MNILLLTTPAQHEGSNPAVLLDDRQLQTWLTELPVMNVVETVKALHQALVPFNELQLDNALRLKLLEHYRQAIDEIFYSYDEMRLKQLPVSNEVRQEIKADIMWLYLELANGYKIVVKDVLNKGLTPRKDNSLLLACYRAMEQIIHGLVNAYRNHQAPPSLAYLEINQLYQIAETHSAEGKKVSSAKRESAVPTISNLYKQFMLLALADPMNLPEGMAFDLFFIMEQFARQCRIDNSYSSEQWIYTINLTEDDFPKHLLSSTNANENPDIRYFDVGPVFKMLEERIGKLKQSDQDLMDTQEIQLLQTYNRQASGTASAPDSSTRVSQKNVQLSFGLEATHYFMTDDHYAQHQASASESFGIEVRDVGEDEAQYELESWSITETSKNGRMLLVPQDITYQDIELGMLIGIYEQMGEGKPPMFTLAIVRWLPADENEERKIGLQIIPGRPQPISCTSLQEDNHSPCLYMPSVAVLKQPASLIIPSTLYRKGKYISLNTADSQRQAELLETVIQTPFVTQCLYQ